MAVPNCILLVENDAAVREEIRAALAQSGYDALAAADGSRAAELLRQGPVALMLLGARSAAQNFTALHTLTHAPVIVIGGPEDDRAIEGCLEAGAVDFLMLPLRPYELLARVRAVMRRVTGPLTKPGWILTYDDLALDLRAHVVVKCGHTIPIARLEMRLLSFFMRHAGETISKERLLKMVWGYENITGDLNLVDTAIKRLRQTIEDDPRKPRYILTVWGTGYRLGQ